MPTAAVYTRSLTSKLRASAYRKLIFTAGQLLGAILIGYPDDAGLVARLVKRGADLSPVISALHRGRWNELARLEAVA